LTFLIILDGAEESISFSNGRSPIEEAFTPNLDKLLMNGISGKAEFFPTGMDAESLVCIPYMLGVPEKSIPRSRAPIEALGAGFEVKSGSCVCRCNLVSVENGRLASFNGGNLGREQMKEFALNASRLVPPNFRLYHLSDYRNLLVVDVGGQTEELMADIMPIVNIAPPHQNLGKPVDDLLKSVQTGSDISKFICEIRKIKPGFMLYPWGAGQTVGMPSCGQLFGKSAACVCKAEIMSGIAKALGMAVYIPPNATGDFDTDLEEKAQAALNFARSFDIVVIHINGTDELAHRRDLHGKIKFIEAIDALLLGVILSGINRDARFIVTSDHVTSSETGRHENLPVKWYCAEFNAKSSSFTPPVKTRIPADRKMFSELLLEVTD
jgi:2,3-bisphosphoglycerate-independent phosphoglycerate mutase